MKVLSRLVVVFGLCLFPLSVSAKVIFVAPDAPGQQTGESWHDAFKTVDAAIQAATQGDEVWVKQGRYEEAITLSKSLALYGGFEGDESARDESSWKHHETILDGKGTNASVVTIASKSTLYGFTVTNGNAERGGGIYCEAASPTIENCQIVNNSANEGGGGVFCYLSACPELNNCVIANNQASAVGGGLFCFVKSSPKLNNCVVSANSANEQGGGMFCWEYCSPVIESSTFSINSVTGSGAAVNLGVESFAEMTNCLFVGNQAGQDGAAVYCFEATPTLLHCTLTGNQAGEKGGALFAGQASNPTVTNCILWDNLPEEIHGVGARITYSDVTHPVDGIGNISETPYFVQQWNGIQADIHLQSHSPCIDTATTLAQMTQDMDALPRPYDVQGVGFDGVGQGFDMGADEYHPPGYVTPTPTPTGDKWWDVNEDGFVDGKDLLMLMDTHDQNAKMELYFVFAYHWHEVQ